VYDAHDVLQAGDRIGRYEVKELLGKGGMGAVYRVRDPKLQREIALKVLLPAQGAEARSAEAARLLREARAAAALDHPNGVAIYDVGESEGLPYIAMELIRGKSLRWWISQGSSRRADRLRWLAEVASALAAAHRAGIVHRDVKPENVMIRDDGVAKVLDFGIARRPVVGGAAAAAHADTAVSSMTAEGAVVGTLLYMAPEQLRGERVDARADQFAWGVMAYELMSGAIPWANAGDGLAVVGMILSQPAKPISDVVKDLPAGVAEMIMRALSKEADGRFPSMDTLVELLRGDSAEGGEPASDVAMSPTVQVSAATLQSLTTGAKQAPAAAPGAGRRWMAGAGIVALCAVAAGTLFWRMQKSPSSEAPSATSFAAAAPTALSSSAVVSENPQARAAYAEGVQAWFDGSPRGADKSWRRAVQLDSGCAAAHLRIALVTHSTDAVTAREAWQGAVRNRSRLSPRDAALLEATEPCFRQPWDLRECEARLRAGLPKVDDDHEWIFQLARLQQIQGALDEELATLRMGTRRDPVPSTLWFLSAQAESQRGNLDAALSGYDRCLSAHANASFCRIGRWNLLRQRGDCGKLEAEARSMLVQEAGSWEQRRYMVAALFANGAPSESIEESTRQMIAAIPDGPLKIRSEFEARVQLALMKRDLPAAEREARDWLGRVQGATDAFDHTFPALTLMEILEEQGKLRDGAKVAEEILKKLPAWTPAASGTDPTLSFHAYLARAGAISRETFSERRADWLRKMRERPAQMADDPVMREWLLWWNAYALHARTADDAKEALQQAPKDRPIPVWRSGWLVNELAAAAGRVFVLAGQLGDALPMLGLVAQSCPAPDAIVDRLHVQLDQGKAFEATGDTAGARKAWDALIAEWGASRSTTVEEARKRLKGLPAR
jgi:eukaryotic-like serine/threonine-protein kinase